MTPKISSDHPLHRFFSGLVEHAMYTEVGLCDPAVVDYLAHLLTRFIHKDAIFAIHDDAGRPLDQIADMLERTASEAARSHAARDLAVHRHIGDYALFWVGVFPENLKRLCARDRKDYMIDYFRQGKRSYAIAAELAEDSSRPPGELLARLSERFEYCVMGLGRVREHVRTGLSDGSGEVLPDFG